MDYIISYTLQHDIIKDKFVDHWLPFYEDEDYRFDYVTRVHDVIIQQNGGEAGYSLWTINISVIVSNSDKTIK